MISHAPFTGRAFPAGGLSSKWPLVTLLQNEASSPSGSDSRGKRPDAAVGRLRLWGGIPVSKRRTDVHHQGSCVDTVHRRSGQWESQPRVGWTARSAGRRRSWDRVPWEGASLGCWPVTAGRPRGGRSSRAKGPLAGQGAGRRQSSQRQPVHTPSPAVSIIQTLSPGLPPASASLQTSSVTQTERASSRP